MIVAHIVRGPSNTNVLPHNELGPVKLKRLVWNSSADSVELIGKVTWPSEAVRSKILQIKFKKIPLN